MTLGQIIKNHRGDRTLAEIHETTGISIAMLSLIESDQRNPSDESLEALAEAFDTTAFNIRFELEWGVSWASFGKEVRNAGDRKRGQLLRDPSLASAQ